MGFLEDIYDSGIFVADDFGINTSKEYKENELHFREMENQFLQGLTKEQVLFYENDLLDLRLKLETAEQQRMFKYAFRLACSMLKDCFLKENENTKDNADV